MKKNILKKTLAYVTTLVLITVLFQTLPQTVSAEEPLYENPGWLVDDTGTYFEITNSSYLNVTLSSSEIIHVILESYPNIVSLCIKRNCSANSTIITLTGFEENKTYYIYEDGTLKDSFTIDANGSYSYIQDLLEPHHVYIKEINSTIYINSDGSISPSTAPISRNGEIYTLTNNIYDVGGIVISRSGITIDGQGYILQGSSSPSSSYGLYLTGNYITVKNLTISGYGTGIYMNSKGNITMTNNMIINIFYQGISCAWSDYITIIHNTIVAGNTGISCQYSLNMMIDNNTISITGQSGNGIYCIYSVYGTKIIKNNLISNYSNTGIQCAYSQFFKITDNELSTNSLNAQGINFGYPSLTSANSEVKNNKISNGYVGIRGYNARDFTIENNTISNVRGGYISGNGIQLQMGGYVLVNGNTIINCSIGILLYSATYVATYHNNIINNTNQVFIYGSSSNNTWDNGQGEGNYWSDYTGVDDGSNGRTAGDGIGDTLIPHPFTGYRLDNYPLINQWVPVVPVNYPPIADAGGPYTANEGEEVILDASGSTDPDNDFLVYRWDVDNNGEWDTGYLSSPICYYTWSDDYSGLVKVEVSDNEYSAIDTTMVTVSNIAPTIQPLVAQTVNEGSMATFTGIATDPGSDDLTFTWNWGGGSVDTVTMYQSNGVYPMDISDIVTHFYGDNDIFTVTLTVEDDDEGSSTSSTIITINNENPKATILGGIQVAGNYIYATIYNGQSYIIEILDNGSFATPQLIDDKYNGVYGAGAGDFDNDGDIDSLMGDARNTWYYEKLGPGNDFAPAVSIDSTIHSIRGDFAEADFNGDGNLDAILADRYKDYFTLYFGNGDGTFIVDRLSCQLNMSGLDAADFNGDGNMDFVAGSVDYGAYIYISNGDGTFQSPIFYNLYPDWTFGICAGDFDNDNDVDLIYGFYPPRFYSNNGDGTFGPPVNINVQYYAYYGMANADINGDGNLDLLYSSGLTMWYYTGNGDGTFTFKSRTTVKSSLYGLAVSLLPEGPELNEGEMMPVNGSFSDSGWLDTHTASWDWGDGSPIESGVVTEENIEPIGTGEISGEHCYGDNGEYTITLTVVDDDGGSGSDNATFKIVNVPPIGDAGADISVDEGDTVVFDGSGTYDPGFLDVLTYDWIFGYGSDSASGINLIHPTYVYGDNAVYTATLVVTDDDGGISIGDTVTITSNNVAPEITSFSAPVEPIQLGNSITIDAAFTDQGFLDTHSASIDWGDGNTESIGTVTSPIPTQTHSYTDTGVFTVTLMVTDDDGGSATYEFNYVVIYDPYGGFVTGGGWIISPTGAYTQDPTLAGTANFGFVSKYIKGQTIPSGNTEFNFKVANMNFHSENYQWLVITNVKAMFKGTGTINGQGNYGFIVSAIDEALTPSTDIDLFRIKIWDKNNNDHVIYDNQLGAENDSDPITAIGGGNIVIHSK